MNEDSDHFNDNTKLKSDYAIILRTKRKNYTFNIDLAKSTESLTH